MGTPQGPPLQQMGFSGVSQAQPVVDPATLPPLLPDENLVPPMPPKNKGGRPKSDFWAYFTEQGELRGKTNRKAATCNFCGWAIGDARVDTLARHITSECKKVTREARDAAIALAQARKAAEANAPKKAAALASPSGEGKRPAQSLGLSPEGGGKKVKREHTAPAALSAAAGQEMTRQLDSKLLRFLVVCDLPFRLADSAFLLDLLQTLRPSYVPASSLKLRTSVLTDEVRGIQRAFGRRLENEEDLSLGLTAYCPPEDSSLLACTVFFKDRTADLLDVVHVPGEGHTAEYMAGELEKWVMRVGATRVGSLVLDNNPAVELGADLLLGREGFRHILKFRCVAQAFSLAIGSMLGQPWARSVVTTAQRMVTSLLGSPALLHVLRATAKAHGLSGKLQTCNRLQFASVHMCLASLMEHEAIIRQVVVHQAHMPPHLASCHDPAFWLGCDALSRLTEPFATAMAGVQAASATSADLIRSWLIFARIVHELDATLAQEVVMHCTAAFNRQYAEMDNKLLALTLFMDPRYKSIADSGGNFRDLIKEGVTVLQKRGYGEQECVRLLSQMQSYKAEQPPFDLPKGGDCFLAKSWWLSVQSAATTEIVALALFLLEVAPHAATPERLVGSMGWMSVGRRSWMLAASVNSIAAVRTHCERHVPLVSRPAPAVEAPAGPSSSTEPAGSGDVDLLELDVADVASPEELDSILTDFYNMDITDPRQVSYTQVEAMRDFDLMHPALAPGFDAQAAVAQPVGGLGKLRGPSFDVDRFLAQHLSGGQR